MKDLYVRGVCRFDFSPETIQVAILDCKLDLKKWTHRTWSKDMCGLTNCVTRVKNSKSGYTQAISKDYTLILSIYLRHVPLCVLLCALELWYIVQQKERM